MAFVKDASGNTRVIDKELSDPDNDPIHPFAITPSDTINGQKFLALRADVGGTVSVFLDDTTTVSLTLVTGAKTRIAGVRVNATGTAATGITGWR